MGALDIFRRRTAAPVVAPALPARPTNGMRQAVRSLFKAADTDRLSQTWEATPITADQVISLRQKTLVARSREQASNNDYAKAFLRMCRQNIGGAFGVMLQAQSVNAKGKLDQPVNDAIEVSWADWGEAENCDVTGKRSFRTIVNGAINDAAKDGEFMIRIVTGREAGPWGFALQPLDPQRCPSDFTEQRPRSGEAFIRNGIGFNKYGRPLSYFFASVDETEEIWTYGGRNYIRIPAEEIVHGFIEEMTGQKRGLPWMASSLFRMRHLGGMEEAAVINARIGAAKMGFIQYEAGFGPEYDENNVPTITSEAGEFVELPEGATLEKWDPLYPAGEYAPFIKSMLRGIAAGMGVPYNELAADLEGVNFSSIRQGTLDSREHWKDKQEWLIEVLHKRVFKQWLPRALLRGAIKVKGKPLPAVKIDIYSIVAWQGRRWAWIDPRADVDAAVDSKNNFLASSGQIIRESGRDPATVWAECARDIAAQIAALEAEGIDKKAATELVMLAMGKQPEKPVPPAAAKKAPE